MTDAAQPGSELTFTVRGYEVIVRLPHLTARCRSPVPTCRSSTCETKPYRARSPAPKMRSTRSGR